MKQCPVCNSDEWVTERASIYTTTRYHCMNCNLDFDVNKTNADRIRAMSDEELAEFVRSLGRPYTWMDGKPITWVEWLQQEVE